MSFGPRERALLVSAGATVALTAVLYVGLSDSRDPPDVLVSRNFDAQLIDADAPDFTVTRKDGSSLRLSELRGKVVFVNFWATWCAPCRQEIPDLEKLSESLKNVPFEIVAVSGDDSWEEITSFFGEKQTRMIVGLDKSRTIARQFGTEKFPETYVVDRHGRLRLRFVSVQPWTDERIHRYLEWLAVKG
ncbi:MAG: TlpA family protein disulfide reductase [Myxococcales bacterium]|nr:TlpA family protein disulfide reductase [Myxococcales bacterium]